MHYVDKDIIEIFEKSFNHIKKEPLILYGIGEKTKLLVENLPEYNFVALLDKSSVGYKIFGIDVIDINQAVNLSKNIIIVANYSSAHIIYSRIVHLQKSHNISIYYMNGEEFSSKSEEIPQELVMEDKETLLNLINSHDVISVDFFDTLAIRKAMFPSDVFTVVESKIKKIYNINFVSARIESEKIALSKFGKNTNINHIYNVLQEKLSLNDDAIDNLKKVEIETESLLLTPRTILINIINEKHTEGKEIIITSDMYFPKEIIKIFAQKCGINKGIQINVSCDFGKTKYHGDLWEYYLELYKNTKILHIGDDDHSDIIQAKKYAISTFKIFSVKEIFDKSSLKNISNELILKSQDRLLLGSILSKIYNNPFCLCSENKKVNITSISDIGYIFYGPLIYKYMTWLISSCIKEEIKKILFISRDGFILNRLFKLFRQNRIEGIYFYTSRRALSVSTIKDNFDIIDVFNTFFLSRKITYGHFLEMAFGIKPNNDDKYKDKFLFDLDKAALLSFTLNTYSETILTNSKIERIDYLKYIDETGINEKDKVAIINFVSNGVTQHFFEKLLPQIDLNFFYFLTKIEMKNMNIDFKKVNSLYGEFLSSYTTTKNSLIKHFLTAESVFSAPDGQFIKFNNSIPFFREQTERNFENMSICHDGIENFFLDILNILPNELSEDLNLTLIDNIFGVMFNEEILNINDDIKKSFSIEDDYTPNKIVESLW